MIFGKIKLYLIAAGSVALAVFYALFNRERSLRYRDKAKSAQRASKTLTGANKAIAEAEKRGKERLKDDKDDPRNHFE